MSVKAMGWAYDQRVEDPIRKAVLVALGNIADEEGYCWPSIARIAWMAEVSPRTAQRAVQDLEMGGFLHIERDRRRENGSKTSNAYRLPIEARQLAFDTPPIRQRDASPLRDASPSGVRRQVSRGQEGGDTGVTCKELPLEPSFEPSGDIGAWPPATEWNDFAAMRKQKGKPITPKARELLLKKLKALEVGGHAPAAVLLQSVEMGWTGIFPIRTERSRSAAPNEDPHSARLARNKAAADEFVRSQEAKP